jgi:hypothetical protein
VKAKLPDDRTEATRAHETWAMDFVHDQLATGSKLRILTVVDLFSRLITQPPVWTFHWSFIPLELYSASGFFQSI